MIYNIITTATKKITFSKNSKKKRYVKCIRKLILEKTKATCLSTSLFLLVLNVSTCLLVSLCLYAYLPVCPSMLRDGAFLNFDTLYCEAIEGIEIQSSCFLYHQFQFVESPKHIVML